MSDFDTTYNRLNIQQKEAVNYIYGPLLVIAGPGTGKTELLSVRVANILKKTDSDPGSILCLAFTNYAVANMRARLTKLIGPTARLIQIKTFHSLAADIMAQQPDYFWNGADLSVAPDSVQLSIIESILSSLPLSNPLALRFAGQFTSLKDTIETIKLAKEAGLTPEKLETIIKLNLHYIDEVEPLLTSYLAKRLVSQDLPKLAAKISKLPDQAIDERIHPLISLSTKLKDSFKTALDKDQGTSRTTYVSQWKSSWVQSAGGQVGMHGERRRNQWWLELAKVYAVYRDQLYGSGYYDYSDMILEVIGRLESQPLLLASVQEKYQFILIDEFQDSNQAQLRLAHFISAGEAIPHQPNLMAVGDDDQTIFAFNGAELNNMLRFRESYPRTKTIVLKDSYRSQQTILSSADQIIRLADSRLVYSDKRLSKDLISRAKNQPGQIKHLLFPTQAHQLSDLASQIKLKWQSGERSIAVLARHNDSLKNLSSALLRLKVPVRYEKQTNVLHHAAVAQMVLMAEVVQAIIEGDSKDLNFFLSQLVVHPMWHISDDELWRLATTNFGRPDWLGSLNLSDDQNLTNLASWLRMLSREAVVQPLPAILEYFIGLKELGGYTSPLKSHYLSSATLSSDYLEALSAINVLRALSFELSGAQPQASRLADFLHLVELHQRIDQPLSDQSWFASSTEAIELMTVHKAKGLEFDIVYLIDVVDNGWRPRRVRRPPPANLPPRYGDSSDDYIRLLYVAATRARYSFIVSSFEFDEFGQQLLASPLISHLPLERQAADQPDKSQAALETSLSWPRLNLKDERLFLKDKLENFNLSATGLIQFLDVSRGGPGHFLASQLLRLPEARSPQSAYGTAMHRALQEAQILTSKRAFKLKIVLDSFTDMMLRQSLPTADFKRYNDKGRQVLSALFKGSRFKLDPKGQAETVFKDVLVGQALIEGKLDNLLQSGSQLLISDYKTGSPLRSFSSQAKTSQIKIWQHSLQLIFYVILASSSGRYKPIADFQARVVYLEADDPNQLCLNLEPTKAEIDRTIKLINAVWRHVSGLIFPNVDNYQPTFDGIKKFETDLIEGKI